MKHTVYVSELIDALLHILESNNDQDIETVICVTNPDGMSMITPISEITLNEHPETGEKLILISNPSMPPVAKDKYGHKLPLS